MNSKSALRLGYMRMRACVSNSGWTPLTIEIAMSPSYENCFTSTSACLIPLTSTAYPNAVLKIPPS